MTLKELLNDRYAPLRNLSHRSVVLFESTIDRLRDHLGREPALDDLTDLGMAKFLRWRATTPHKGKVPSPASVAKDKAHLASLGNYAFKKKLIEQCVEWPRIRVPMKPPRGYTVDELSAIVRQARVTRGHIGPVPAPWFWQTLLVCAWESGERIGSLLRLRWEEVDLEHRMITLLGQHRKDHITTIHRQISPQLVEWLKMHRGQPGDHVWPWLDNRHENSIFPTIRRICRLAGVKPRGFHAIRKASGSYVRAGGGDASEHLGHANPRTTRDHYLDPRIVRQQSALDFLPPLDLGPRQLPPKDEGQEGDKPAA
jgi:integrase